MAEHDAKSFIQGSIVGQNPNSVDSEPMAMDFTFNNNADSSASTSGSDQEKLLEFGDELMVRGFKAAEEGDFTKAIDCYGNALNIRVAHFGELAPECIDAYYKYGWALLNKVRAVKSDAEVLPDGGQEKPGWYLAWDKLNTAREIVEKHFGETMQKVEILSALAEVAMDRAETETSVNYFLEALSILQRLVEPDNVLIAELNFRISVCLQSAGKLDEAISYSDMALSVCKSRLEHLTKEIENVAEQQETLTASESSQTFEPSSSSFLSDLSLVGKEAEIQRSTVVSNNLEKLFKDLPEQFSRLMTRNTSIKSAPDEVAEEVKVGEENVVPVAMSSTEMEIDSTGGNIETSTVATGHTGGASGVTHKSSDSDSY